MANTSNIIIYGKDNCPYCVAACQFLDSRGLQYTYIDAAIDPEKRAEMQTLTQGRTFPQIIINGKPIGGYSDMMALVKNNEFA